MKSNTLPHEIKKTQIDRHPTAAVSAFLFCGISTLIYYFSFKRFNSEKYPWIISFAIQTTVPTLTLIHYFFNKKTRRMWCEGCISFLGILTLWMPLGSWSFIYFSFAPLPYWEKTGGITACFCGTIIWLWRLWKDYVKFDDERQLKKILFSEESERFIFRSADAESIISCMPQRNPFSPVNFFIFSSLVPLLGIAGLYFDRTAQYTSGPHMLFIFLSSISLPVSQWLLGYMGLRAIYFHVYLPLKIERETGKKVILAP